MAVRRAGQLLRLGVGTAALVSIPAMTYNYRVFAADQSEIEGRYVVITKLPMYENPEDQFQYHFEPEKISILRQAICDIRETVWDYMDTVQETTDKVKEKFEVGRAHTESVIDYLQNDPGMLPRAVVITVAGLGGVVAGYRGGTMRKVLFSTAAIAAATSLCYPKETVEYTTEAYEMVLNSVNELVFPDDMGEDAPPVIQEPSPTTANNSTTTVKGVVAGDHGQSKAEDKDLYTTRSN